MANNMSVQCASSSNLADYEYLADLEVGNTFTFGNYRQDEQGKDCPIEWKVLQSDESGLLAVSSCALEARSFDTNKNVASWQKCSLRTWLNDYFYKHAFNFQERQLIAALKLDSEESTGCALDGLSSNSREADRVFLLCKSEVERLFSNENDRCCEPTQYAKSRELKSGNDKDACVWWLRSQSQDGQHADAVDFYGKFGNEEIGDSRNAVRPAIKIKGAWIKKVRDEHQAQEQAREQARLQREKEEKQRKDEEARQKKRAEDIDRINSEIDNAHSRKRADETQASQSHQTAQALASQLEKEQNEWQTTQESAKGRQQDCVQKIESLKAETDEFDGNRRKVEAEIRQLRATRDQARKESKAEEEALRALASEEEARAKERDAAIAGLRSEADNVALQVNRSLDNIKSLNEEIANAKVSLSEAQDERASDVKLCTRGCWWLVILDLIAFVLIWYYFSQH